MLDKIKQKKILFLMIGIFLFGGIMTTGSILASITKETSVVNHLSLDTVDISLTQYMKNDSNELVEFEMAELLKPGDVVSIIPTIENKGVKAYVRVKIDFSKMSDKDEIINENLIPLNLSNLHWSNEDEWFYSNGYYYYKEVLDEYETIQTFDSVNIPTEWDMSYMDARFHIDITAESVQAQNFKPDFDSENPWGDITVEKTVRTRINNE